MFPPIQSNNLSDPCLDADHCWPFSHRNWTAHSPFLIRFPNQFHNFVPAHRSRGDCSPRSFGYCEIKGKYADYTPCPCLFSGHFVVNFLLNPCQTIENTAGTLASVTVDLIALDTSPIAVGGSVVLNALVFGVKVEEVSPISTLVTATGSIVKI